MGKFQTGESYMIYKLYPTLPILTERKIKQQNILYRNGIK